MLTASYVDAYLAAVDAPFSQCAPDTEGTARTLFREATPAKRAAYTLALDRLIARTARLEDKQLRALVSMLNDARRELAAMILDSDTDWKLARYTVMRERIRRTLADLGKKLHEDLTDEQKAAWRDGAGDIDALLRKFDGERRLLHIPPDLRQLAILKDFSADLITRVSRDVIDRASAAVRTGLVVGRSPNEVIKEIGRGLIDRDGNPLPGVWGDTLTRATVIYRTETTRALTLGQQTRMIQHDERVPGLQKTWVHSGRPRARARQSHVEAERNYKHGGTPGPVGVGEMFSLRVRSEESSNSLPVGEYKCMYPRDPRLPPGLSVNCGCAHAPWREYWAELDWSGKAAA